MEKLKQSAIDSIEFIHSGSAKENMGVKKSIFLLICFLFYLLVAIPVYVLFFMVVLIYDATLGKIVSKSKDNEKNISEVRTATEIEITKP
ncbi:MAG: hypothetical protein WC325_09390 [Candidatus Bathyarchaeia archaeon]|jgi:hypothetical protein